MRRFHREQNCPCMRRAWGHPSNQANKQPAAKVVAKTKTRKNKDLRPKTRKRRSEGENPSTTWLLHSGLNVNLKNWGCLVFIYSGYCSFSLLIHSDEFADMPACFRRSWRAQLLWCRWDIFLLLTDEINSPGNLLDWCLIIATHSGVLGNMSKTSTSDQTQALISLHVFSSRSKHCMRRAPPNGARVF